MNTENAVPKKLRQKPVKLTPAEFKALKKWVKSQHSIGDAVDQLGFTRQTLHRVLILGSGFPNTIDQIRKVLQSLPEPQTA